MRTNVLFLFLTAVAFIFISGTTSNQSLCDSPYVGGHTGAPGETACNGCHSGTLNSGNAVIDFDLGTNTYVPGQAYQGFVRIQQSGFDKFGFSCLALKNSDSTTVGTFGLVDTTRSRTYADADRDYVSHTPCGADSSNANSWYFTWTAPNTNEDTITLYIGALAANHNHATSGDFSYTRKIVLPVQTVSGFYEVKSGSLKIYPNPVIDKIAFQLPEIKYPYDISISDITGKIFIVKKNYSDKVLNVSQLTTGIYYLHIKTEGNNYSAKFQKQ
jgi:hypothetical protein